VRSRGRVYRSCRRSRLIPCRVSVDFNANLSARVLRALREYILKFPRSLRPREPLESRATSRTSRLRSDPSVASVALKRLLQESLPLVPGLSAIRGGIPRPSRASRFETYSPQRTATDHRNFLHKVSLKDGSYSSSTSARRGIA